MYSNNVFKYLKPRNYRKRSMHVRLTLVKIKQLHNSKNFFMDRFRFIHHIAVHTQQQYNNIIFKTKYYFSDSNNINKILVKLYYIIIIINIITNLN